MTVTVEAVYENDVLKPIKPLPFKDKETLEITVKPKTSWVEATAGIIGWAGSHEELRHIAVGPDLDPEQSA